MNPAPKFNSNILCMAREGLDSTRLDSPRLAVALELELGLGLGQRLVLVLVLGLLDARPVRTGRRLCSMREINSRAKERGRR